MADVSQAILLPDVGPPSDHLLKTLSLYWEEITLPEYLERAAVEKPVSPTGPEDSEVLQALVTEGIVSLEKRQVELPPIDASQIPEQVKLQFNASSSERRQRMLAVTYPVLELINERGPEHGVDNEKMLEAAREIVDNIVSYAARQYVMRVRDSFELSTAQNLAPVARSAVSHVASMVGDASEAPRGEAALLSTAIQAFEVDPATPLEQIIAFRERNAASLGRLRASLVDLSEGLRRDADAQVLLAEARDRYRNRVVPALGELEAVLKEGKIKFFLRSLMGATAITLSPIDPVKAVEGGALLVGQTINYSFSREKLLREHPFGYLHQVSSGFGASGSPVATRSLTDVIDDPEQRIREIFINELTDAPALDRIATDFWFGVEKFRELERRLKED
jgi:hypothetical protein